MIKKISILLICIAALFLVNYQETRNIEKENQEQIIEFFKEENVEKKVSKTEAYLGVLEIPKLNLKRGFYEYKNPKNTVEKGLEIINQNCLPYEPCSFIIASHSGTSNISFFKNLDKLAINDTAILYYEKNQKEYRLKEILHQEKKGTITLPEKKEPELVLTTCNKEKDNMQDIYLFTEKK